jgi:hypothetical protein
MVALFWEDLELLGVEVWLEEIGYKRQGLRAHAYFQSLCCFSPCDMRNKTALLLCPPCNDGLNLSEPLSQVFPARMDCIPWNHDFCPFWNDGLYFLTPWSGDPCSLRLWVKINLSSLMTVTQLYRNNTKVTNKAPDWYVCSPDEKYVKLGRRVNW